MAQQKNKFWLDVYSVYADRYESYDTALSMLDEDNPDNFIIKLIIYEDGSGHWLCDGHDSLLWGEHQTHNKQFQWRFKITYQAPRFANRRIDE